MKILVAITLAMILALNAAVAGATGLTRTASVKEYFLANGMTMEKYFNKETMVRRAEDTDLRGDIYEFNAKSPFKAFVFSLAVPGAGQFYNGSKIKAGTFLAVDVLLWTGYLSYHSKGSNMETDYKAFADQYYRPQEYFDWWYNALNDSIRATYSHNIYPDSTDPYGVRRTREYYENIGKYGQFQVGWDDIAFGPPPETSSPHRDTYLSMRRKSNDYFSNATTMAMISIANHLVSAFEAAIGAKRYNKGSKQYSLEVKSRNVNGRMQPFVVLAGDF